MDKEETKINDFLSFIEKRIIDPIDEININESCTATILLIFAAIDSLSKITCGDKEFELYKEKRGNKNRFVGFLEGAMNKKYNKFKEEIYDLRNDIVHTGINAKAILSKDVHNVKHLQKVNGYLWINTKQFFKDFTETFEKIKTDIRNKGTFYINAKNRLKNFNIINIDRDEYDEAIPSTGPDDSFF
jgi:hypothetical protein